MMGIFLIECWTIFINVFIFEWTIPLRWKKQKHNIYLLKLVLLKRSYDVISSVSFSLERYKLFVDR